MRALKIFFYYDAHPPPHSQTYDAKECQAELWIEQRCTRIDGDKRYQVTEHLIFGADGTHWSFCLRVASGMLTGRGFSIQLSYHFIIIFNTGFGTIWGYMKGIPPPKHTGRSTYIYIRSFPFNPCICILVTNPTYTSQKLKKKGVPRWPKRPRLSLFPNPPPHSAGWSVLCLQNLSFFFCLEKRSISPGAGGGRGKGRDWDEDKNGDRFFLTLLLLSFAPFII